MQEGKEKFRSLDDLETNFWVNSLAHDKFAVATNRYRRTFTVIPDAPTLKLPNSYTILREDPEGHHPPNALLRQRLAHDPHIDSLKGNILVLKHAKHNRRLVENVTDGDIAIINLLLDGYMAEPHARLES